MNYRIIYYLIILLTVVLLGACAQAPADLLTPSSSSSVGPESGPIPTPEDALSSLESTAETPPNPEADESTPNAGQAIVIQDHSQARDAAVVHVSQAYELEKPGAWREEDITQTDLVGSTAFRYTSGPWVVHVTAPVVALEEVMYTVTVDHIQSGLHWEGMVNAFSQMAERNNVPSLSVTSPEEARDWALASIERNNGTTLPTEWVFKDTPQTMIGATRYVYISGPWVVSVIEPASAPKTGNYKVAVDNSQDGFHWDGEVSAQGGVNESNP